jgi:hypothetical protein
MQQADLRLEHQAFIDRFEGRKWTPTLNEWLRHASVQRQLLLATLQDVPGVDPALVAQASICLDPAKYDNTAFLEWVYAICASRREE